MEEFGRRWDSDYFSAKQVFWQTTAVYVAKDRVSRTPSRILQGNILTDENEILSQ